MHTLNLSGVACPLNFVKTKLKLEELQAVELLEVILEDGESIINVPRSVKKEGHQIVLVKKIDEGHYKLVVKKAS